LREHNQLFEQLWSGAASLEEWTATVSGRVARPITAGAIAIHMGYQFGNVTAIRTEPGWCSWTLAAGRETASHTLAALRRWDDSPVHTVTPGPSPRVHGASNTSSVLNRGPE
jgi:hypothetical protein